MESAQAETEPLTGQSVKPSHHDPWKANWINEQYLSGIRATDLTKEERQP